MPRVIERILKIRQGLFVIRVWAKATDLHNESEGHQQLAEANRVGWQGLTKTSKAELIAELPFCNAVEVTDVQNVMDNISNSIGVLIYPDWP